MGYKIAIKERAISNGRVSLEALFAAANVLRMAIRAQTPTIGVRKSSGRGRIGKAARDASGLSLTGVGDGSGVLMFEPENASLFSASGEAFDRIVDELLDVDRSAADNDSVRKALLTLESLVKSERVEYFDFTDSRGRVARADASSLYRLRLSFQRSSIETVGTSVTGRLMELDIASRSFRLDDITGEKTTVRYDELFQSTVVEALNRYVTASVKGSFEGGYDLFALEIAEISLSSFYDTPLLSLKERLSGAEVITSLDDFAMEDPDGVSSEEFSAFLHSVRAEQ